MLEMYRVEASARGHPDVAYGCEAMSTNVLNGKETYSMVPAARICCRRLEVDDWLWRICVSSSTPKAINAVAHHAPATRFHVLWSIACVGN
jgi:hypothetical protein